MRLDVVGCGDAFGTGGRANTCFLLEASGTTVAVDFGASSLPAMRARGHDPDRIDAVVISHLHGDHFGGVPFLVLDAMYVSRRTRPLVVAGPVGTRARLDAALETLFPGATEKPRAFALDVIEVACGEPARIAGLGMRSVEVRHPSGAPSTAVRLEGGGQTFAYSGDTEWTDALIDISTGADLFVLECYAFEGSPRWHLDYATVAREAHRLSARRIMLTHFGPTMIGRLDAIDRARFLVAEDGLALDV